MTPLHLDLTHYDVFKERRRGGATCRRRIPRRARSVSSRRCSEKGIRDLAVLRAFEMTPRHAFVPTGLRHRAYEDAPLPIGNGQTISQPWVHARYLELLHLTGKERVLEIGTGSGYQTVLLAHLVAQVFSIERIPALMQQARETIQRAGVDNVSLLLGDGTIGWREYAPYDAILVGAGRAVDAAAAARSAGRGWSAAHSGRRSRRAEARRRASERTDRSRQRDVAPGALRAAGRITTAGSAGDGAVMRIARRRARPRAGRRISLVRA